MKKRGIMLVNLGTPEAPTTGAVRTYLREFLSDPRVLSVPGPLRWLLLNLIILPTRPKRSAAAYQKVWTEQGSPLLVESQGATDKLRKLIHERVDPNIEVELAMRYGNPSMQSVFDKFCESGVTSLTVVPLYPQFASASTGSTIEKINEIVSARWAMPSVQIVGPFYDHPGYIEALAAVSEKDLKAFDADHTIFSFHGVPENHCTWGDPTGAHCLKKEGCCEMDVPENRQCYRAHCVRTANALRTRLGLTEEDTTISFQSRLGRTPWIRPFTDEKLVELGKGGTKKLAIFSPAFVADCLETLEELGMEGREDFLEAGGDDYYLAPCVNTSDVWINGLFEIINDAGGFGGSLAQAAS